MKKILKAIMLLVNMVLSFFGIIFIMADVSLIQSGDIISSLVGIVMTALILFLPVRSLKKYFHSKKNNVLSEELKPLNQENKQTNDTIVEEIPPQQEISNDTQKEVNRVSKLAKMEESLKNISEIAEKETNNKENYKPQKKGHVFYKDISSFVLKNNIPNEYVVLDTETTGLSQYSNEIIELALLKIKGNTVIEEFDTLIKPKEHISFEIQQINHITNEMVADKKTISEYIPYIKDILENNIIVGHNVEFDIKFLEEALYKANILEENIRLDYIDTCYLARHMINDVENYKLETLKKYLNINEVSHRALGDCYTTFYLLKYITNKIKIMYEEREENEKLKQLEQENKLKNLNDLELNFIKLIKDNVAELDKNIKITTNILKDYSIKFFANGLYIGKVRIRGSNYKIELIGKNDSFLLDNLSYDDICKHSERWLKYIEANSQANKKYQMN